MDTAELWRHQFGSLPSATVYTTLGTRRRRRCRGLALLVRHALRIDLDKSQQCSDWDCRPWTPAQVQCVCAMLCAVDTNLSSMNCARTSHVVGLVCVVCAHCVVGGPTLACVLPGTRHWTHTCSCSCSALPPRSRVPCPRNHGRLGVRRFISTTLACPCESFLSLHHSRPDWPKMAPLCHRLPRICALRMPSCPWRMLCLS